MRADDKAAAARVLTAAMALICELSDGDALEVICEASRNYAVSRLGKDDSRFEQLVATVMRRLDGPTRRALVEGGTVAPAADADRAMLHGVICAAFDDVDRDQPEIERRLMGAATPVPEN